MASKGRFSLEAIFSATDKLSAPIAKIKTKLAGLGTAASGAMKGANKLVDRGMAGIGRFSSALGIAGVASVGALGFALKDTIQQGAEFERTMVFAAAQFPGMIRQGTAEFEALKAAAMEVGDATEFSAKEAAEGLTLLATAGLSAEQSIAALPKMVNFAMASKVDFAQASDIANDAMGAFGLTSKDTAKHAAGMSRVMDVLTRAAADSTTNVGELFEAVKMGGPIASTAGASLEEFVGMSGALAGVGIKGAEAGTAIRNAFLELGAPSSAATKGLKKLGVTVALTKDGAIDMTSTIGRFAKASKKMTKAQKIQALGAVFGARTVGPFIALMDKGVDVLGEMTKGLQNASGTTEGMATILQQDTLGALRQFDSLLEGLKLSVFDAIKPVLLDVVKGMSDWVKQNRELIKSKAGEWAIKLRDNLPEIWMWAKRIAKAFAAFVAFAVTVKVLNTAILAYQVASTLATGATWLWNASIGAVNVSTVASRIATVALRGAQLASRGATLLLAAAQFAYSGKLTLSSIAALRLKGIEVALRIAQLASRGATIIAGAAQAAYATVVGTSSGALVAFRAASFASIPAIVAQGAALAPLLITLGAAAAAVMALVAAWNQYNALDKELAGSGGVSGTIGKMVEMGTFDPFKAHDAAMNEKAREKRDATDMRDERQAMAERPQIISPQARAARENAAAAEGARATVDGTITVEAKPGTSAQVKAKPRGVELRTQPSGAF